MSIFNKRPPQDPAAESPRARRSGLTDLRNTPAVVKSEVLDKFGEIYGTAMVNSTRWFIFGMGGLVLAICSLLGVLSLLPLKEVRPWVVEVNPQTGVVNRPVEVLAVDPNVAVVKAELARWVESVYTIDQTRTVDLLRWANGRCADKCLAQFGEFRAREKIYERLERDKDLSREAKVITVDVAQKGVAFVFVQTSERLSSSSTAAPEVKRYRVTLNYRFAPAKQEQDLFANPLGIVTTFFSDAEERKL